jgi:hypothetical protein
MLSVPCRDSAVLFIFVLETGKDRAIKTLLDQLTGSRGRKSMEWPKQVTRLPTAIRKSQSL